jgi:hypothetical protein
MASTNVIPAGLNRWKVRSHSDRRKNYVVVKRGRIWRCGCPPMIFHKVECCKHIADVKAVL